MSAEQICNHTACFSSFSEQLNAMERLSWAFLTAFRPPLPTDNGKNQASLSVHHDFRNKASGLTVFRSRDLKFQAGIFRPRSGFRTADPNHR